MPQKDLQKKQKCSDPKEKENDHHFLAPDGSWYESEAEYEALKSAFKEN